jgi:alkyl sulfatase BDS1-like metallo-beta-lactamase superfamily hydrolase
MKSHGHLLLFATRSTIVLALVAFASSTNAQTTAPPISVKQLAQNVYVAQGGVGSNMSIIIGNDGVVVVDAKTTADAAKAGLGKSPSSHPIQ